MASKKKRLSSDPKSPLKSLPGRCIFCDGAAGNEEKFGKFITKNDISVHYFCLLFSSALVQRGTDKQGVLGFLMPDIKNEIKRGRRLKCFYCKRVGATVGCVVSSCRRAFHFGCGVDNGGLNQFCKNFSSFCVEHRPRQSAPTSDRLAFHGTAKATCSICMCAVEARASDHTLRAPCCKNSWFHRSCVQKHATCAGVHFFKCPLCNNKEIFQEEMLTYGIYLPDQDAAWELEPNAFEELLERHTHCDMPLCVCEKGRDFHQEKGKWHVVLCQCCGAKGCHVACGSLKGIKSVWDCDDCRGPTVARKSPPKPKTQKKKNEAKKQTTKQEEEDWLKKKIEMLGKPEHQRCLNTKSKKRKRRHSESLNEEAQMQAAKKRKKSSKHNKSLEGTTEATASNTPTASTRVSSGSSKKRSPNASQQLQKGDKHPRKRSSKSAAGQDRQSLSDYNPADSNKKKSIRRSLPGGRSHRNTPMKEEIQQKSKEVRCLLQADVHTRANLGPKLAAQFSSNCKISKTPASPLSASGDSVNILGSSEGDFPLLNLSVSPGYSSIGVPSSVGSPRKRLIMSCTDNEEILMISDDENEPMEKRGNASDKSFLGDYSNQAKKEAGNSTTPAWARKLLNDDILTGANLGSKFASQFNSLNSSRHGRRLSRKMSQFYSSELDQQQPKWHSGCNSSRGPAPATVTDPRACMVPRSEFVELNRIDWNSFSYSGATNPATPPPPLLSPVSSLPFVSCDSDCPDITSEHGLNPQVERDTPTVINQAESLDNQPDSGSASSNMSTSPSIMSYAEFKATHLSGVEGLDLFDMLAGYQAYMHGDNFLPYLKPTGDKKVTSGEFVDMTEDRDNSVSNSKQLQSQNTKCENKLELSSTSKNEAADFIDLTADSDRNYATDNSTKPVSYDYHDIFTVPNKKFVCLIH